MTEPQTANIARILCLLGAGLGAIGLVGHLAGLEILYTVVPGEPPMQPNTGLALFLIGIAAALRLPERPGRARLALSVCAALAAFVIGFATTAEYVLGLNLPLDELLFQGEAGPHPGRPSPPTAVAVTFLSAAIIVDSRPTLRAASEWLIVGAGVIAFTAMLGQLFGAGQLYWLTGAPVTGVAVPTALGLLLAAVGLLLERPDVGLARIATSPGPGGMLLRRLAPAAVLILALFGLLAARLLDHQVGIKDVAVIFAVLTVVTTLVSLFLLAITAVNLNRVHDALEATRELLPEIVFETDARGRLIYLNRRGLAITGYTEADLANGITARDMVVPAERQAVRDNIAKAMSGAELGYSEYTGRRKDGSVYPVLVHSSPIIQGGVVVGLRGAVIDITERKRAESEQRLLSELGASLAATLEVEDRMTSIARLVVRDLADFCIIFVAADEGGAQRLRVVGRDPSKSSLCDALMRMRHAPDRPPVMGSVLETRQSVLFEKVTPEVLGSWSESEEHLKALRAADPKSAITVPLLAHGKHVGAISMISSTLPRAYGPADVRIAEAIAQRAALSLENARLYRAAKRATEVRDEVLGIVAHDLRNPLQMILLQTALLRRRSGVEAALEVGETIERAANRMSRLIQDLIDVTRMEASHLLLRLRRQDPARILSDTLKAHAPLASDASVELRLEAAPDLPEIWADRDRLLQVFENLIGNAIKFTKTSGHITLGAVASADEVRFSVADTGSGIAGKDLPHLFDRFWQGREVADRGAGLGLAIVKSIVEEHGGRIWVESVADQGSAFFFTIPAAPQATPRARAAQYAAPEG